MIILPVDSILHRVHLEDYGATLWAITAGWVILDLFSLYVLPGLRQRVFRIRRVQG